MIHSFDTMYTILLFVAYLGRCRLARLAIGVNDGRACGNEEGKRGQLHNWIDGCDDARCEGEMS